MTAASLVETDPASAVNSESGSPSHFVENQGQFTGDFRYLLRAGRNDFYFTRNGVVVDGLKTVSTQLSEYSGEGLLEPPSASRVQGVVMRVDFIGASDACAIVGEHPLPTKLNYYIGDDPARWRSGLPAFARLEYRDLYAQTDLLYYMAAGRVKYDLRLRAGANPDDIAWKYEGTRSLDIDDRGNLVIETDLGSITEDAPVAFQIDATGSRREIRSVYRLISPNTVGFALDEYERDRELTIDPGLAWSTLLGGAAGDEAHGVALTRDDNPVVIGRTSSPDFPTSTGAYDRTQNGGADVFVARFSSNGRDLVYSTYLGGQFDDLAFDLDLDTDENVHLCGYTYSTNFPTTPGAYDRIRDGVQDAFVAKLESSAGALVYSTYLGGSSDERPDGLAIDSSGRAAVTGWSASSDFPTTPGVYSRDCCGVFLTKFNASGSALAFSTFIGAGGAYDVIFDRDDNAFIAGCGGAAFPTTPGAYDVTYNGGAWDVFVSKLDPDATRLVYSTFIGGDDFDVAYSLDLAPKGEAVVLGHSSSADFPNTASRFSEPAQAQQFLFRLFATQLDSDGASVLFSNIVGSGYAPETGNALLIDSTGRTILVARTEDPNFPTTFGAFDRTYNGIRDGVLCRLRPMTGSVSYSTLLGGSDVDNNYGVALDSRGDAVIAGATWSSNFPTTRGAYDEGPPTGLDGFVAKIALPSVLNEGEIAIAPQRLLEERSQDRMAPMWASSDLREQLRVSIYDLSGRIVKRFTCEGTGQTVTQGLPSGIYLIRVDSPSASKTIKRAVIR